MKRVWIDTEYLPAWAEELDYSIAWAPWWARWLMSLTNGVAITIGSSVYLRPHEVWWSPKATALIAHELVHVRQWSGVGRLRFAVRYVWQLVTRGYFLIDYEREAYAEQSRVQKEMATT